MAHLYASFQDAALAEKAAGALLDYGVRQEDLSIVVKNTFGETRVPQAATSGAANAAVIAGDRLAQIGDRMAGALAGFVGAPASAAVYDEAALARAGAAENRAGHLHSDSAASGGPDTFGDVRAYDIEPGAAAPDEGRDAELAAKQGISTTTPEDAGEGAVKGAEIGLGLGILAGVAALLIPGVGLVTAGGALASAIGAAALTAGAGAIAGGVTGYLKEQGVPGDAAERYQGAVESGGAVLNVTLPSGDVDQATAEQVIAKYHAADVHSY